MGIVVSETGQYILRDEQGSVFDSRARLEDAMPMISNSAQSIVRRTLELVPETFSEGWLRETWSGGHGRLRLRPEIKEVSSTIKLKGDLLMGEASVGGNIVSRNGVEKGRFNRGITLEPNGRLNVYHAFLALDPAVHKSGFASRFNNKAYARYAEAGVDDVTVSASLSAGGFVWARTGFELKPHNFANADLEKAQKIKALVLRAKEKKHITRDEYKQLVPRLLGRNNVLTSDTLVSIRDLANIPVLGEKVLLGSSWSGIRQIRTSVPWWAGKVPAAITDALMAPAYLRSEDVVPRGVQQVRAGISALMPDALNQDVLAREIVRATAGSKTRLYPLGSETLVDLVDPAVSSKVLFSAMRDGVPTGGTLEVVNSLTDARIGASIVTHGPNMAPSKKTVGKVIRQLGVEPQ